MMVKPSCCQRTLVHMESSLSGTSELIVVDSVVGSTPDFRGRTQHSCAVIGHWTATSASRVRAPKSVLRFESGPSRPAP